MAADIGMDERCRCPHPDHKDGACERREQLNCPSCKTALCVPCASLHHPRQHHADEATEVAN